MAFRDDRDALLARNDALERKAELGEKQLAEKRASLEEAEARATEAEKERDALARKLRKLAPTPEARARKAVPVFIGAGAVFAVGIAAFVTMSTGGSGTEPDPPRRASVPRAVLPAARTDVPAERPDPADVRRQQRRAIRIALDQADHAMRLALRDYPGVPPPGDRWRAWEIESWSHPRVFDETAAALRQAATTAPADPGVDDAALAVAEATAAVAPPLEELMRYIARGDYKDDESARGRALEAKLRAGAATYLRATAALRARLAAHHDDIFGGASNPTDAATFAAWSACSRIGDVLAPRMVDAGGLGRGATATFANDRELAGAVTACADAADALRAHVRAGPKSRDYVLTLFDQIVERAKHITREIDALRLHSAYTLLSQSHAYAAVQFARMTGLQVPGTP